MKSCTGSLVVVGSVFALLIGGNVVDAASETLVRVIVVDPAGSNLTGATVAAVTESGKLELGRRAEKATWLFKGVSGKLVLSVRNGRDGGVVEVLIPAKATEVSFRVQVSGQTVRADSISSVNANERQQAETVSQLSLPALVPTNDDCVNAIDVGALPASVIGDNTGATDDIAAPCGVASGPWKNVWYSVTGTGGTLTASTCNAGTAISDTKISVFCADCPNLFCVDGNDDNCSNFGTFLSTVSWCSEPGRTYFITVGGFSSFTAEGAFELTVTDAGDSCANPSSCVAQACTPDFVVAAPGSFTGNSCGSDDCALRSSEEHIYEVTLPNDGDWTFSLCGSSYDTFIFVGTSCCGSEVDSNDDSCGLQSEVTATLTAGTYYVMVEGFSSCGDYVLDISKGGACDVICNVGDTPESESNCGLPTDTVNGGCNSDAFNPPTSVISCGEQYCGTGAFDDIAGLRDTDWYEVTVAGPTQFTWTVTAEFDALVGLVETSPLGSGDCADTTGFLSPFALPGPCEVGTVVTECLPAGTYRFFAAPDFVVPVACGAEYTARLDCTACTIPIGACCPGDGSCVADQTESACLASGGSWLGDGTTCTPNLCPQPPSNDLCGNAVAVGVPSTTAGTTVAATIDDAFPTCGTGVTSPGVWYSVTGTGNTMTASLCNGVATYDSKIGVYCPDCATAACVDGNDDSCGLQSEVSWCSEAGQTYLILVHGFGGDTGPFELVVSDDGVGCANPPSCTGPCGDPNAGDCCAANLTFGCDDAVCCDLICGLDSFCCEVEWDQVCADAAVDLCDVCVPPPPTGGCCNGLACSIQTEVDCTTAGGTYLGDDTDCSGPGGGTPSVFSGDPNAAIPDDGFPASGASHTITVPDSFTIGDVDVDLIISHTWTGDLVVQVEHLGTTVTIVNQPGDGSDTPGSPFGCGEDNYNIILDDEGAGGAIEDQCSADLSSPPNYTPNEPLSAFDGMDSAGDWTITAFDTAGFDTGTLDHWSLHIDSPGPSPCIPRGACCLWPDACEILTQDECNTAGGIYLGDNSVCSAGGAVTIVNATGLGLSIPDDGFPASGATHTLNVTDSFNLQDVDIDVAISHTWTGDLVVEVEHLGTVVTIVSQPGDGSDTPGSPFGCGEDNYDIILDDEGAGGAIEDQCSADLSSPPNYTPNNPLSAFDGMTSAGDWTISVFDTAGFDTGTLEGWSVHMTGPSGPGPCVGVFPGACCDGNTGTCTDDVLEEGCVGDQATWYKNIACADLGQPGFPAACVQHDGACCDGNTGICVDNVLPGDCVGDQQSWSKSTPCSAVVCEQHTGACCDGNSGICVDDVLPGDCMGDQQSWSKSTLCSAIVCVQHTGACCDGITGVCTDDVLPGDCAGANETWHKNTPCANVVCEPLPQTDIPTVSAWGVVVLTLLLLVVAKVYFRTGKDPAGA